MNDNEPKEPSGGASNNGKDNGKRPTFLAKLFGFAMPVESNGSSSHVMTSDGAASVDIEKLLESDNFKRSAAELKRYAKASGTPTP